jgi:hypothetical protein
MMPFQQNCLHLQKQNLDIFTKYGFFYLFTLICKPKGMFVGLWSLNSVELDLNFSMCTMISKRATKSYLLVQM